MRKLALLSLTCAFLLACKKEQPPINPAISATGFNPKYEQIEPLILAFKQTVNLDLQGNLKTSSTPDKPVTEAEWTLEAALNFDHSHPVQMYNGMDADTLTITCSNNGTNSNGETMVDGGDLAQAYANLLIAINNLLPTGQDVEVIDVEVVNETQYTTTFRAYVTAGVPLTLQPDYVKPDDFWTAGDGYGKCDGTQNGLDATDRIDQILNFNILNNFTMNLANPQQVLYYTSIETKTEYTLSYSFPSTFPIDITKWLGQYQDPYHSLYNPPGVNDAFSNTCIDPTKLNFYLSEVWSTISIERPLHKDIIWVDVENSGLNTQSYPRPVFHYLELVRYGVPVL